MNKLGISASEVARRTWGTTVDSRGRTVAKNRDRVGHYLAGTSYPEPDNLEALAKAVEVPVETLAIERPASAPLPRAARAPVSDLQVSTIPDRPGMMRLQVDRVISAQKAAFILGLLENITYNGDRIAPATPDYAPGDLIPGGKDDDTAAA